VDELRWVSQALDLLLKYHPADLPALRPTTLKLN
jgi:hypothetical protein